MPVAPRRLPVAAPAIEKKVRPRELTDEDLAWEDYFIPGTDTLRNKLGVSDQDALTKIETQLSMSRVLELQRKPISGDFGFEHMKRIHHHLFQDVYEWAGQRRTVNLNKAGYQYAPHQVVERMWEAQSSDLLDDGLLRGIADKDEFADKLAYHWGAVNFAHAFREGNTRSQMVFFAQLADQAGWELDITRFDPAHPESVRDQFIAARFHHQGHGFDHEPLAKVLSFALTHREPELQRELHPGKDLGSTPHQRAQETSSRGRHVAEAPGAKLGARYRRFPELMPEALNVFDDSLPKPSDFYGPTAGRSIIDPVLEDKIFDEMQGAPEL